MAKPKPLITSLIDATRQYRVVEGWLFSIDDDPDQQTLCVPYVMARVLPEKIIPIECCMERYVESRGLIEVTLGKGVVYYGDYTSYRAGEVVVTQLTTKCRPFKGCGRWIWTPFSGRD